MLNYYKVLIKKITVFTIINLFFLTSLLARDNMLENYKITSFNGVTRLSLTFSQRPVTNVKKEANALKISINIPNCNFSDIPASFDSPDIFAKNIKLSRSNNDLNIEVSTQKSFEQIRQSGSRSQKYIVHLDIIKTYNPQDLNDFLSLIDYYNYTGNKELLGETISKAKTLFPDNPQIANRENNRFPNPQIFMPQHIIAKTQSPPRQTQRTQARPAPESKPRTQARSSVQTPTTTAQPQTVVTPKQETPQTKPAELSQALPIKTTDTTQAPATQMSFTLVTAKDRFPSRIPMSKPLITKPISELPPQSTISDTVEQAPVSTETAQETPVIPQVVTPERVEIVRQTVSDTVSLSDNEKTLIKYYNIAKADSILTDYMIGRAASIVGDYDTALDLLKKIPENNINFSGARSEIYRIYKELGDTKNALIYSDSDVVQETFTEDTSFFNTPVKLWMTLIAGLLSLGLGFFASTLLKLKQKDKSSSISEDDLAIHKEHLRRAYENKEIYKEDSEPEIDDNKTINTDDNLADHYDNPPIVTENIDDDEELELIEDETSMLNIYEEKNNDDDSEMDLFGDDEYKKKMVLKLHNDGWDLEEIAKELQMSQREIDFIIKMNQ